MNDWCFKTEYPSEEATCSNLVPIELKFYDLSGNELNGNDLPGGETYHITVQRLDQGGYVSLPWEVGFFYKTSSGWNSIGNVTVNYI